MKVKKKYLEVFEKYPSITMLSDEDVVLKTMNNEKTVAIEIKIADAGAGEGKYAFYPRDLIKTIKTAGKNDEVELLFSNNRIKVVLKTRKKKKKASVALKPTDPLSFEIDSLNFTDTDRISLSPDVISALLDAVDDAAALKFEKLTLVVKEGKLQALSEGMVTSYAMELPVAVEKNDSVSVDLEFLKHVKKFFKLFNEYEMYIRTGMPLLIRGHSEDASGAIVVAPVVED